MHQINYAISAHISKNYSRDRLDGIISSPEQKVVIGGDFNVTFDSNLDCFGGSPTQKESVKVLEEICLDMDLVDIWRLRNPDIRLFTWKQTKPLIQRRLDFWFKDINDKRVLWDLMKYRIRQVSMKYSKEKARLRKVKIFEIEKSLTVYQEKCATDPSTETF